MRSDTSTTVSQQIISGKLLLIYHHYLLYDAANYLCMFSYFSYKLYGAMCTVDCECNFICVAWFVYQLREVCASSSVVEVRSNLEHVILLAKRRSVTAQSSQMSKWGSVSSCDLFPSLKIAKHCRNGLYKL